MIQEMLNVKATDMVIAIRDNTSGYLRQGHKGEDKDKHFTLLFRLQGTNK